MVVAKTYEKEKKVRQGDRFSFSPVFFSYYCFHFYCWRALCEPTVTILYKSGKKPKFFGCKIRSMRNGVFFFCAMTSRKTHMDELDRFQENFNMQCKWEDSLVIAFLIFQLSLFACGSIHQRLDPEHFSDKCRGRREIYICLATLFAYSWINGGVKISIKLSFTEIVFFSLSAFSSSEVAGKK